MATQTAVKPSLTIKRRLNAPPAQGLRGLDRPAKNKAWFGPGQVSCTHAEFDLGSAAAT